MPSRKDKQVTTQGVGAAAARLAPQWRSMCAARKGPLLKGLMWTR